MQFVITARNASVIYSLSILTMRLAFTYVKNYRPTWRESHVTTTSHNAILLIQGEGVLL